MYAAPAFSQNKPVTAIKPDENSVVADSSGSVYPYVIWKKLTQSGDYTVVRGRFKDDPDKYLLIHFTEEMKKSVVAKMKKPRESPYFITGEPLKSFSLRDLNGTRYKLKDLSGKVVVLNFWFVDCPPCKKEIPDLNKLAAKYKDNKDVVLLGIALDDAASLKEFLKTNPFNYNIVSDGRYDANNYGVKSYPTHVVTNRQSRVVFHTNGLALNTVAWVEKSIEDALNEQATPESPALTD